MPKPQYTFKNPAKARGRTSSSSSSSPSSLPHFKRDNILLASIFTLMFAVLVLLFFIFFKNSSRDFPPSAPQKVLARPFHHERELELPLNPRSEDSKHNDQSVPPIDLDHQLISSSNEVSYWMARAHSAEKRAEHLSIMNNKDTSKEHLPCSDKKLKKSYPIIFTPNLPLTNLPPPDSRPHYQIVILIHSAAPHFKRRSILRTGWMSSRWNMGPTEAASKNWRAFFVVGKTKDDLINDMVKREAETFGDLIVGDFMDGYFNMTQKILTGLNWAYTYTFFESILKVDDDVFVHLPHFYDWYIEVLKQRLNEKSDELRLYAGLGFENNPVLRPDVPEDAWGFKWHVSTDVFKEKMHPPMCSGFTIVLSRDVVRNILPLSLRVPQHHVDDAFIGVSVVLNVLLLSYIHIKDNGFLTFQLPGLLTNKAGYRITQLPHIYPEANSDACNDKYLISVHGLTELDQQIGILSNALLDKFPYC